MAPPAGPTGQGGGLPPINHLQQVAGEAQGTAPGEVTSDRDSGQGSKEKPIVMGGEASGRPAVAGGVLASSRTTVAGGEGGDVTVAYVESRATEQEHEWTIHLWALAEQLGRVEGRLVWQLLVHTGVAQVVCECYRQDMGHLGANQIEAALRRQIHWLEMGADVGTWTTGCAHYTDLKAPHTT
ncbi:hypothetical protein AAFF_G00055550 [Aldrovandia affinis]|uniref:Integrase zinc-binding domain-containing protein n=1 Tax=Aldrovandia affinis TaxID=143900 RepID=A0AAD7S0M1_9TELE|nr:hypothetical protein AAFF_G00055550 [Aldrovandia affinis]